MNGRGCAPQVRVSRASLNGVLAARIVTAATLGTLVVAGVLWLPPWFAGGLFAIAAFLGALEWAALAGIDVAARRMVYAFGAIALAVVAMSALDHAALHRAVLVPACLWWLIALAWIAHYQVRERPAIHAVLPLALIGWLSLVPALVAVWTLLVDAPLALLALFGLVWSADILAFVGGRALGRRRLASRVSPGKTWEGLFIAVSGTLVLAAVLVALLRPTAWFACIVLALVTVLAAAVGDLLESLLKRLRGVKDSGTLLPGHGGVLDRIDSILAAAPAFTLGIFAVGPQ